MHKSDVVEQLAETLGSDKAAAGRALDAVLETIATALAAGDSVTLSGFGTFDVRHRAARMGRNPQTGEALQIAASSNVGFKAASGLKNRLS